MTHDYKHVSQTLNQSLLRRLRVGMLVLLPNSDSPEKSTPAISKQIALITNVNPEYNLCKEDLLSNLLNNFAVGPIDIYILTKHVIGE